MSVIAWRAQPIEQARILNPAFLGALLLAIADGYQLEAQNESGLPYALTYLALPVVLHKPTRDALPSSIRTSMVAWLSVNASVQIGIADRAAALVPLVRDAIVVAAKGNLVALHNGRINAVAKPAMLRSYGVQSDSMEVRNCLSRAKFVGRWFALAGDFTTVMALWGVRP